jgi:hypothetical protein
MPATEWAYWEQRAAREYLGRERDDYGLARIEAAIVNWSGFAKEGKSPLDLMVFRERSEDEADPMTEEQREAFAVEQQMLERLGREQGDAMRAAILAEQAEAVAQAGAAALANEGQG